jgi:hypothetical protein
MTEPYPCDKYTFIFQENAHDVQGYTQDNEGKVELDHSADVNSLMDALTRQM